MPDLGAGRTATIEGRTTLVRPSGSGLPRKLDDLLGQMASFGFSYATDVRPAGARTACTQLREHRFVRFREGRWFDRSGIRRGQVLDLRLRMCRDCGAVEVRDVSIDVLTPDHRVIQASRLKRRDHLIGWYSGSRPGNRTYK